MIEEYLQNIVVEGPQNIVVVKSIFTTFLPCLVLTFPIISL